MRRQPPPPPPRFPFNKQRAKKENNYLINISLRSANSQCSRFSTSTSPHWVFRPRTLRPLQGYWSSLPTTANGIRSCYKPPIVNTLNHLTTPLLKKTRTELLTTKTKTNPNFIIVSHFFGVVVDIFHRIHTYSVVGQIQLDLNSFTRIRHEHCSSIYQRLVKVRPTIFLPSSWTTSSHPQSSYLILQSQELH